MTLQHDTAPKPVALGLSAAEASERLGIFGPNRIARQAFTKRVKEVAQTFADPMALMLGAASAAYFFLNEALEAMVLLCALVPGWAIDVILQARARGALKQLAQAVAPRVIVLRDGKEVEIDTERIVPGDAILVKEGGIIYADGVLRVGSNLTLDESQLTGESEPQGKEPLEEKLVSKEVATNSLVYAGSRVLSGHGWVEVTATGARTDYGNLAQLVAAADARPTPLQQKTSKLVQRLVAIAIMISAALLIL